jgi:quercetin dioxygenase-like cupin family protein
MATELEELAALDAAGALDDAEQRVYRERLSVATREQRAAIAQLYDVAASVARSHSLTPLPAGSRDRLMKRLERSRLYTLCAGEGVWLPGPVPGTTIKILSLDRARDIATLLLRADPGARYPAHHHTAGEDCYVISGEIIVNGQRLHAGDFHRAEPDSDHGVLATDTGAEVLLVVSATDYQL